MPNEPVDVDNLTVTIPRKTDVAVQEKPVKVWPVVEKALQKIGADTITFDAAREALKRSDGCVVLANYLNSEAKRIHKMDYSFKVPLIVLAAVMAVEDGGADSVYDDIEGAIYFETDEGQFSFHVYADWTVDWAAVVDEVDSSYQWSGVENQTWALDQLLSYLDLPLDGFKNRSDE